MAAKVVGPGDGKTGVLGSIGVRVMIDGDEVGDRFSLVEQPMSNQAAALVVLPIAVKAAVALGLNPRTFIVGITYAASFSFITPLEPACVLVYTPGHYRFTDFVKIGTFLTIIVFVVSILLVPIFWPF